MLALIPFLGVLLVNAIPLIGVIWLGWQVYEVLLLYWFENVAIGIAHAVRMGISTRTNAVKDGRSTTTFFVLHYGIFTLVHGVLVFVFFGVFGEGVLQSKGGLAWPILSIFGWQIFYLVVDNFRTGGFKGRSPNDMMFEPYPRVFALHLTVIAGGWFVGELGSPVWALAILVGVKVMFELAVAWISSGRTGNEGNDLAALRTRGD